MVKVCVSWFGLTSVVILVPDLLWIGFVVLAGHVLSGASVSPQVVVVEAQGWVYVYYWLSLGPQGAFYLGHRRPVRYRQLVADGPLAIGGLGAFCP